MRSTPAWRRCSRAACSSRISTVSAAKRWCWSTRSKEAKVTSIVGQGWAPHAVDVDWYLSRKKNLDGAGLDPAVVPGALHAALTVLEKWGTMSFEEVAAPAIGYAEKRFPDAAEHRARHSESAEVLRALAREQDLLAEAGRLAVQARRNDQAADRWPARLRRMVEAERAARARGRDAGIIAARDRFYKGDIAREMVAFLQKHGAPFDRADFAEYFARIEEPASTTYRGYTVYKHGFGSQGPVLLQTLNILEQFDLQAMGYAQRRLSAHGRRSDEARVRGSRLFYADPAFVQGARRRTAVEGLCEGARGADRSAARVDARLSPAIRSATTRRSSSGRTGKRTSSAGAHRACRRRPLAWRRADRIRGVLKDTTHMAIIDKDGNIFDVTPSGGWVNGRGHSRRHGHRHERSRRAVLARQDAGQPDSSACAAALHVDAEPGVQGRRRR